MQPDDIVLAEVLPHLRLDDDQIDAGDLLNRAIRAAYPHEDKSIILSDVDNKPEVLKTINKYL